MKPKNIQTPPLSAAEKQQIIDRWRTSKLNSVAVIAKEFKTSVWHVNTAINEYLSTKIKN